MRQFNEEYRPVHTNFQEYKQRVVDDIEKSMGTSIPFEYLLHIQMTWLERKYISLCANSTKCVVKKKHLIKCSQFPTANLLLKKRAL